MALAPLMVGVLGEAAGVHALIVHAERLAAPGRLQMVVGDDVAADDGAALVQAARRLEASGADFVVMVDAAACAHLFDVERAVGVPVVSVIEEVGAEAARRAPAGAGISLQVDGRAVDLYQADLARRGLRVAPVDDAVLLITDDGFPAAGATPVLEAADVLAEQVVAYAQAHRPLPPPFSWTDVGPA